MGIILRNFHKFPAKFEEIAELFITTFEQKTTLIPQPVEGLNEGLKSLLLVIKNHPGIQTKDISKVLNGRPIKTIDRQIKELGEKGLIERRGSKKTGGYFVI